MAMVKHASRRILLPAVALVGALAVAPVAHAAPSCTTTTPALDQQVTCTYNAGGFTDITVPSGAAYVTVTVAVAVAVDGVALRQELLEVREPGCPGHSTSSA